MIANQIYFLQTEETTGKVHGELLPVTATGKGCGTCTLMRRLTPCKPPGDVRRVEGSWFHFGRSEFYLSSGGLN